MKISSCITVCIISVTTLKGYGPVVSVPTVSSLAQKMIDRVCQSHHLLNNSKSYFQFRARAKKNRKMEAQDISDAEDDNVEVEEIRNRRGNPKSFMVVLLNINMSRVEYLRGG